MSSEPGSIGSGDDVIVKLEESSPVSSTESIIRSLVSPRFSTLIENVSDPSSCAVNSEETLILGSTKELLIPFSMMLLISSSGSASFQIPTSSRSPEKKKLAPSSCPAPKCRSIASTVPFWLY